MVLISQTIHAWLINPLQIKPSAQSSLANCWTRNFKRRCWWKFPRRFKLLSGFFQIWRAEGITTQLQLYCTALGSLAMAGLMLFAGWFHYHKAAPKLEWFQNVESMLNHHLIWSY
jgi:photosystem I P700 chlorophyll a apoprotein A1